MRRILALSLSILLSIAAFCQNSAANGNVADEVAVENTDMARLPYAIDILKQIPRLRVSANGVVVIGRGTPAIFIGNRKVTDLTELYNIAASKVKSVKVLINPGAEYGKEVNAVVVIYLKEDDEYEGLRINEMLRIDMTHTPATNNEVSIGWKKKDFFAAAFLGYNEERRSFEKQTFKNYYINQLPDHLDKVTEHPDILKQRWTGRLKTSYAFNSNHNISLSYSLLDNRTNRTFIPESGKTTRVPETRHDIDFNYEGKFGKWNLFVGNDTYFDNINQRAHSETLDGHYLRKEYDIRTYAKASRQLWKGQILAGAEFDYSHMDVDKYDEDQMTKEFMKEYGGIHALHPEETYATFLSTTQKFGKWNIEAGFRYEHTYSSYKPCADDGLMRYIETGDVSVNPEDMGNPIVQLAQNGKITYHRDHLYPTLKVSTSVGKSQFALSYTQSSVRPYLGLTRITVKDITNKHVDDRMLTTERVTTTSLNWKHSWTSLTASYLKYNDPICQTLDGSVSYNAPDYKAMNINATLSPKFGFWSPALNVNALKQWFYMPLANGKNKLRDMLFNASFNNTLDLPNNWLVLIGAQWHSKGAERNWHYYSPNLCLNASVQKEFPRQGLTLTLSGTNLLRGSFTDITRYTQAYNNISEGFREQEVRMVSMAVKWRL